MNWLMFVAIAVYLRRSTSIEGFRPRLFPRHIDGTVQKELLSLGTPVALTQILNGGMFSAAAVLVGIIGAATLAAQQIVYGVMYLAFSVAGGFGDTVRVRVAYGAGLEDADAASRSARIALSLAAGATLIGTLLLWLFPTPLVSVFLDTARPDSREVLAIAVGLSVPAGMFLFLDGTQYVLANALRGLRDTRSPLWISLLGYWALGLGSAVFFCFVLDFGALGLWWGLVAGVLLCNALLLWRLRTQFRRIADEFAAGAIAPARAAMHH